jgi:phosphate/sulfate permease
MFINCAAVAASFLSLLSSAAFVVTVGTALALPLATSHAVAGALLGISLVASGPKASSWNDIKAVGGAWVLSPLLGAGFAFIIRYALNVSSRSHAWYMFILPLMSSVAICGMVNVLFFSGPRFLVDLLPQHWMVPVVEAILFACVYTLTATFMKRNAGASVVSRPVYNLAEEDDLYDVGRSPKSPNPDPAPEFVIMDVPLLSGDAFDADGGLGERMDEPWASTFVMDEQAPIFRLLIAATAVGVAFADGSSAMGNGVAPFIRLIQLYFAGEVASVKEDRNPNPLFEIGSTSSILIALTGAVAVISGLGLCGHRVTETMGKCISRNRLTFARAFSAQLAGVLSILVATALNLPLSTSHCLVTAIAVSSVCCVPASERARESLDFRLLGRVALAAVLTPLVSAALAAGTFTCLRVIL